MFLSKQTKNNVTYLYLIESSYDKELHQRRKKIVKSFGAYDVFAKNHPEELKKLEEEYGSKKIKAQEVKQKSIDEFFHIGEPEKLNEAIGRLYPQYISHLILRKIWDEDLLMSRHFAYLKQRSANPVEFNVSNIALYFACLKIINPCSYLRGLELSPRFLGDPMDNVSTDDVYRCLHYLSEHKEQILRHINSRVDVMIKREHSLIFYDCTNCYFETPYNDAYWYKRKALRILRRMLRKEVPEYAALTESELNKVIENSIEYSQALDDILENMGEPFRMHGNSKEKRKDLPLVSIALIIDENAIPIDFEIYAGNQSEQSTMVDSIRALKEKYQIKSAVVVADSGLNSTSNLLMLMDEGLGFSVAKSSLSFSKAIRDKHLELKDFHNLITDEGVPTGIKYKIIDFKTRTVNFTDKNNKTKKMSQECKLMITFSRKRQERDLANLEAMLIQAQSAVKSKAEITHQFSGWKQFVETESISDEKDDLQTSKTNAESAEQDTNKSDDTKAEVKKKARKLIAVGLNDKLIEKRKKCAGFAGVLFHEPPTSDETYSPEFISGMYHRLVKIEECFRIMKKDLEIRPMFVRDKDSIKGHVFICVIALIILRLIQKTVNSDNQQLSLDEIKDVLKNSQVQLAVRENLEPLLFKTQAIPVKNSLRVKNDELDIVREQFISEDKIMTLLGLPVIKSVSTMKDIRNQFKLRTLEMSCYQKEQCNQMNQEKIN